MQIELTRDPPHQPAADHLAVFGGRDNNGMYSDTFFLDVADMSWKEMAQPPKFASDVSNHLFAGIESVPNWKIFTFGGKSATMQYLNAVELMDCGTLVRFGGGLQSILGGSSREKPAISISQPVLRRLGPPRRPWAPRPCPVRTLPGSMTTRPAT